MARCPTCGAVVPTIFEHVDGCPSNNVVDDAHAHEVCKIGQGKDCCRYLTMGAKGWSCEKSSDLADQIDGRVAAGAFVATSINCNGRLSR
jgi:hypothetical protein